MVVVCGHEVCPRWLRLSIASDSWLIAAVIEAGLVNNTKFIEKIQISGALKRTKVVEAIACAITVGFAGLRHTLGHHLSGGIFIVRAFFFFFFAFDTDGLVINDR
jgi:hypothetical protein